MLETVDNDQHQCRPMHSGPLPHERFPIAQTRQRVSHQSPLQLLPGLFEANVLPLRVEHEIDDHPQRRKVEHQKPFTDPIDFRQFLGRFFRIIFLDPRQRSLVDRIENALELSGERGIELDEELQMAHGHAQQSSFVGRVYLLHHLREAFFVIDQIFQKSFVEAIFRHEKSGIDFRKKQNDLSLFRRLDIEKIVSLEA